MKTFNIPLRAVALSVALLSAPAVYADGFVPAFGDGINLVGLAVGSVPDYYGSKDNTGGVAPYGRYLFSGQRYVQLLGTELTVNLVDSQNWRFGPIVRYRFGRDDDVSDKVVKKMNEIDDTTEVGLFVGYRMPLSEKPLHQLSIVGQVVGDAGDVYDGVTVNVSATYFYPFSQRLIGNIGLGVFYAGSGFNETYFGVKGSDVALFPSLHGKAYDPSGGVTGVRIPFGVSSPLSKEWLLSAGGRYERLQGDAKDSPVVSDRGDANQWMFGVGVAYLF